MTIAADGLRFDKEDDSLLISAVKQGSPGAADALIRRYQTEVGRIAAAFAASPEDAEDLTQEGLLALLSAAKGFDPEKGVPFSAFAGVCVANRLRSVKRRAKTQKEAGNYGFVPLDSLEMPGGVDPVSELESDEGSNAIFLLTETVLSPLEKNVFYKRLAGLSAEETGKSLGVSRKAAENAYSRAKTKLKAALSTQDLSSLPTEKIYPTRKKLTAR